MSDLRRIPVPGTFNFRDVSWVGLVRGVIRPGTLFRSDSLHALGERGRRALRDLGVGTVIDLRDAHEIRAKPDDLDGSRFRRLHLAVFEGTGVSLHLESRDLTALYRTVVDRHARMVVAGVCAIAQADGAAVLVHCGTGKDRTGIVVALALLAIGADRASVIADYAVTRQHLTSDWLENTMASAITRYGVEDTSALRALIGGSPPEVMHALIDHVDQSWGSIHEYLLAHGMAPGDLIRLQRALVQQYPDSLD